MYKGGNGSKLETGSLDRKRIDDALDKHLEKSSLSTSRGMIGKDKDRLTVPLSASRNQPEHRSLSKNKASDGKVSPFGSVLRYLFLYQETLSKSAFDNVLGLCLFG